MTEAEVLNEKGPPISKEDSEWIYNSVDSRHDGVLSVFFVQRVAGNAEAAWAIEFTGRDATCAPTEMPYLNTLTSGDVIRKYGKPVSTSAEGDTTFVYFRNGIYVGTRHDRVYRYGVFNTIQ